MSLTYSQAKYYYTIRLTTCVRCVPLVIARRTRITLLRHMAIDISVKGTQKLTRVPATLF